MPLGGRVIPEAWFDLLPAFLWSCWCGRGAALLLVKLGGLLLQEHEAEGRAEEGMEAAKARKKKTQQNNNFCKWAKPEQNNPSHSDSFGFPQKTWLRSQSAGAAVGSV